MNIAHNRKKLPSCYKSWASLYKSYKIIKKGNATLFAVTDDEKNSVDLYDENFICKQVCLELLGI